MTFTCVSLRCFIQPQYKAMKAMSCSTAVMRCPRLLYNVRTKLMRITCSHTYAFSQNAPLSMTTYSWKSVENNRDTSFCQYNSRIMSTNSKRGLLHHTPSMGFIGHGLKAGKVSGGLSLQVIDEDHNNVHLNFAESFSTSSSGIKKI